MTILARWEQQPDEVLDWDIYYANSPDGAEPWLSDGDVIVDVTATVDIAGLVVSASHTNTMAKLWISGGSNGVKYKITVTAVTTSGRQKQDEVIMKIKEV